jgi:hypothetical protein
MSRAYDEDSRDVAGLDSATANDLMRSMVARKRRARGQARVVVPRLRPVRRVSLSPHPSRDEDDD